MKLLLQPDASGYNLSFPAEAIDNQLDGGRGRYRADILNASRDIEVTFTTDPAGYNYFMAFYRTQTKRGSEPFEIPLIVEEAGLVDCSANIKPGSLKVSQSGLTYYIACGLEVRPPINPDEEDDDDDIIEAYNTAHGYTP